MTCPVRVSRCLRGSDPSESHCRNRVYRCSCMESTLNVSRNRNNPLCYLSPSPSVFAAMAVFFPSPRVDIISQKDASNRVQCETGHGRAPRRAKVFVVYSFPSNRRLPPPTSSVAHALRVWLSALQDGSFSAGGYSTWPPTTVRVNCVIALLASPPVPGPAETAGGSR